MAKFRQKFHISRVDGTPLPPTAEFFVLRVDDGADDSSHARVAVDYYAQGIQEDDAVLSTQVLNGLDRLDAGQKFYEA
jgi:hypothetical protein